MPAAHDQIGRGFADPVRASQACFRHILDAMAEPGSTHTLAAGIEAPLGLNTATAIVLLTLADFESPVWLDPGIGDAAAAYLRFHTGARVVDAPSDAHFAVIDAGEATPGLAAFNPGDDRYPDRSATVIVQCRALSGGTPVTLTGPGIRSTRVVAPTGLSPSFSPSFWPNFWPNFWQEVAANSARYPLGLDLMFAADRQIMGLPRSCRIVPASEAG